MKSFDSSVTIQILTTIVIFLVSLNIIQFRDSQLSCPQLEIELTESDLKEILVNEKKKNETLKLRWTYSIAALQYLTKKELKLFQLMQKFEFDLENKLKKIESWLDDFKESSLKGTKHLTNQAQIIEEISSHPHMIFRLIRRFVNLKHYLLQLQPEQPIQEYLNKMESESKSKLPDFEDYDSSIENIINLQYVYGLNIHDLINGRISNVQTNVGLTESQAYEIAVHAENIYSFTEAIFWLETLLERNFTKVTYNGHLFGNFEINSTILHDDIHQVSKKHDAAIDEISDNNSWSYEHGFTQKILTETKNETKRLTVKEVSLQTVPDLNSSGADVGFVFQRLCAGEVSMSEKQKSTLYCFYETKLHPNWYINPLKIEVYSWDPYVARIYDAVNETVIQYLQNMSKPNLIPAKIINESFNASDPNSKNSIVDKARIAMFTFLMKETEMLDYLALKIGYMTGLEVYNKNDDIPRSSEPIQIASYALGGWYDYHLDAMRNENFYLPLEGDRIATFMIYLNDVTLGGNTAFPHLGVSIQPIKKSAVIWYNLHKNGEADLKTFHGGCPVLIGQKWIANTWIRSVANFQKRKCSLNPNE